MSVSVNLESDELSEYLIENREKNSKPGIFSNINLNLKQYLPKTGNIENDLAVRFGLAGNENNSGSWCFKLNRKERIVGFFTFLSIGVLLLMLSSLYIPVLLLKARKFSIIFTMGSVFSFTSLTFLWGAMPFFRHLTSPTRLIFTLMYFGSLFATLFFAISLQSYICNSVLLWIE
ncbi:unnamed protein product [Allacma fusca]|uniref:Vesicle transport protein n=1 Tax=Allacma fusca TaxID=39272 RepID=A0A8J2JBX1_9HEXA|nr:unnamed protein product [Allacma fusca]